MTDPIEIMRAIKRRDIIDYDGILEVKFLGRVHEKCKYSIAHNAIWFEFAKDKWYEHKLTSWLFGISKDDAWSVEWFNR